MNVSISTIAFYINEMNLSSIFNGIYFGVISLSLSSLIADTISHFGFLKKDQFFSLRRCFALSLFSCIIWMFSMFSGAFLKSINSFKIPEDSFYLGLFIVLPIRFIFVISISRCNLIEKILYSMLHPFLCLISTIYILDISISYGLWIFFVTASLSLIASCIFLSYVEYRGQKKIGISPIDAFNAFLLAWLDQKNYMLENFLDKISVNRKISVAALKFKSNKSKNQNGLMVVSNFHPGPFMSVGSSNLPFLIQRYFEKKLKVNVSVPHGITGHEGNLTSQRENSKVIKAIEGILNSSKFSNQASKVIEVVKGHAIIKCQRFDDNLLITLTQSPEDMEDLPNELHSAIQIYGKKFFKNIIIVDAHNSINKVREFTDEEINNFKKAAYDAINKITKSKLYKFKFGSAKRIFKNFTLEEGFGPGGLVVNLIEVNKEIIAYMTIDGNNMVPELRNKILALLEEQGVKQGEVLTTDTHMVNGFISSGLGYNPIGKAIDQGLFLNHLKKAIKEAKSNLVESQTAVSLTEIDVKSLGSVMLENLTRFMYGIGKLVLIYIIFLMIGSFAFGLALLI
jgi:putative membrane protein